MHGAGNLDAQQFVVPYDALLAEPHCTSQARAGGEAPRAASLSAQCEVQEWCSGSGPATLRLIETPSRHRMTRRRVHTKAYQTLPLSAEIAVQSPSLKRLWPSPPGSSPAWLPSIAADPA